MAKFKIPAQEIAAKLAELLELFPDGYKITLVADYESKPDSYFILGDMEADRAVGVLQRAIKQNHKQEIKPVNPLDFLFGRKSS